MLEKASLDDSLSASGKSKGRSKSYPIVKYQVYYAKSVPRENVMIELTKGMECALVENYI